jgi:hypothetical protein
MRRAAINGFRTTSVHATDPYQTEPPDDRDNDRPEQGGKT